MKTMKFKESNPRKQIIPNGKKKDLIVGDCVVRAITHVTGKPYKEVFVELTTFSLSHESCNAINCEEIYEDYLFSLGFTKHKPKRNGRGKTYCVKNFPTDEGKRYVLLTSGHLTAIVDGEYLDTWDCGEYRANSYYEKVF